MDFYDNLLSGQKKNESEVLMVDASYRYWRRMLFGKLVHIFRWSGLPFRQHEIEMRLMSEGYCGFVKDKKVGLMAASGGMSGVTQYWDEYTMFTYAAPTAYGGTKLIYLAGKWVDVEPDDLCVIVNNTSLRSSMIPLVDRTASLLSHVEISLKVALVNMRESSTFSATDQAVADNIKAYHAKMYKGELDVIVDTSLIDAVKQIGVGTSSGGLGVKECLDARKEIIRNFLAEIGVRSAQEKRERQISSEVNADTQLLLFNLAEMLDERKRAAEQINEVFGLNVSVDMSPEFDYLTVGGVDDVNA